MELSLARDVRDNNRGSLQYISSNRKIWENIGSLLMVTKDPEKAELSKVSFSSVFTAKAALRNL